MSECTQQWNAFCYIGLWVRFDPSTDVSGFNQAKSSVVRGVRAKLVDQYPPLADYIDDLIPKKEPLQLMKWQVSTVVVVNVLNGHLIVCCSHEHVEVLCVKNEMLFFKQRDGPYIPTLRLLHKCEC